MIDSEFSNLVTSRIQTLNLLVSSARNIANADDSGDILGALRLTELAAQQVRIAITRGSRGAADKWEDIAYALGCTAQDARTRFE